MTYHRLLIACIALLMLGTSLHADNANVFKQGQFTAGQFKNPRGWGVPQWLHKQVNVITEGDQTFLRITRAKQGHSIIGSTLPLAPTWSKLKFSVWVRVKDLKKGDAGWKMSRIEPVFPSHPKARPPVIHCHPSDDWQQYTAEWDVPLGATSLKFMVGFWESSGTFDLKDMTITVSAERELTAEQKATLEKMRLGEREPQTIPANDYFASLKKEFTKIGPAYFVVGGTEAEAMKQLRNSGEAITVEGQPFKHARKVHVPGGHRHPAHVNLAQRNREPIYKGDTVLVTFWAKGRKKPQKVDDGQGAMVQPFIKSLIDGPKHRQLTFYHDRKALTEQWQRYFILTRTPSKWDFPPGKLELLMMLGHKAQDVQIGGVAWMIFPKGSNLAHLPKKNWSYLGRAADAPWRTEAAQRIEKYRKGDLRVQVVDANQQSVPNAKVHVAMQRHAFLFGTATANPVWVDQGENGKKYRETILKYFNGVGPENSLKWVQHRQTNAFSQANTKQLLEWARKHGLQTRGHVLVWPSIYHTPHEYKKLAKTDPVKLQQIVRDHVTNYVTTFHGLIDDWDVTNETGGNRDFMDMYGPMEMVEWYRLARAADPNVKLTFLEPRWNVRADHGGGLPAELREKHGGWVGYLLANNAPIDRLGTQGHSGFVDRLKPNKHGKVEPWAIWDAMVARHDKDIVVTELDVRIDDAWDPDQLAYQADVLRDSVILAFAHPRMTGVQLWGFWEGRHWAPTAALWRRDWTIKPIGQAWIDLVYKRWWTDETVTTNAQGQTTVRAFFGEHEVTVHTNGKKQTQRVNLVPGQDASIVLRLD